MANDKQGRGRRSKVDVLPKDIKAQLDKMLRDGRLQQQEIRDIINNVIEEAGLDNAAKLSRTGLNRYSTRMEKVGARIRQAREISQQWISTLGTEPEGDVSNLVIEMIRNLAFETTMNAGEQADPMPPKMLKELAMAVERLERAASESQKREQEIKKRILEEAASRIDSAAQSRGFDKQEAGFWRDQVLKGL